MAESLVPPPTLPPHVDESLGSIAQLHAEHHQSATPLQRSVDSLTNLLGRPQFIGVLLLLIVAWVGYNVLAEYLGRHVPDPPPFSWLSGGASLTALFISVLILATQRRENELAQLRDQLTLELAIVNERKTAKIIQLLEESRRDNPLILDRVDEQADAMAEPADPQTVLAAIKETHAEAEQAMGFVDDLRARIVRRLGTKDEAGEELGTSGQLSPARISANPGLQRKPSSDSASRDA